MLQRARPVTHTGISAAKTTASSIKGVSDTVAMASAAAGAAAAAAAIGAAGACALARAVPHCSLRRLTLDHQVLTRGLMRESEKVLSTPVVLHT